MIAGLGTLSEDGQAIEVTNNLQSQTLGVAQGIMANDLRNSLLKQQLGDSATKKLVTREEGAGEQQETS